MKKLLTCLFCGLLAIQVCAYENTYAIIIGVADYKNYGADDGDLKYTTKDAKLFYDFLKSKKGGSVPAQNIVFLTDAKATKANIISQGKNLFAKANRNDRVILYFSGHGSKGCFVPYDAGSTGDKYLYFSEVKAIFRNAKCKTKLLFADACFSGSMKKNETKAVQELLTKEVKATSDMNIAVMMSCKGTETSIEMPDLHQGLFTYYLIKGLGGLANTDNNQYVTIKELFYYVYKKTQAKAASIGHTQTPELFGKFDLRLIVAKI